MNAIIVLIGAAGLAAATTFTVIAIERPSSSSAETEMLELTRQLVENQSTAVAQILRQQELLRGSVLEMAEAQQEMLHRDKQTEAREKNEIDQSQSFFERNMRLTPR
jgi:hypothetical protein